MADFTGGPGNDVFNGTEGNDTARGGGGADTLNGNGGTDFLFGEDGNDTIGGGADIDYITGGGGADNLSGDAGDDYFLIDLATDIAAGERIDGGSGIDQLAIRNLGFGPAPDIDISSMDITGVEQLMAAAAGFYGTVRMTAQQLAGFTSYIDASFIQLTTGGSVTLGNVGGRHGNIILANASTTLDLRDDPDNGGSNVTGGSGDDVIRGSTQFAVRLTGGGGDDALYGGNQRDNLQGGEGNDRLEGGANEDRLFGDAGNDTLHGDGGFDHLHGGAGLDLLYGGDDDDELILESPTELTAGEIYDGGAGTDTLRISGGGTFDLSAVTLAGVERLENIFATVILSTAQLASGFAHLSGTISISTSGAVTLDGSYGNASFLLNAGGNSLDASGATGGIRVTGSDAADSIVGSAHFDQLAGGGAADTIDGGGGHDHLRGGAGADTVRGGDGDDVIFYDAESDHAGGEQVDGGAGLDTIRWSSFASAFTLNLSTAILTGIEAIDTGSYSGNALLTAAQLDSLSAVSGNFTLTTGGAVLMAGVGSAAEHGSPSTLTFTLAAAGNRFDMTGYETPFATVLGQGGADTVIGGAGRDNIYGGGGDDTISGNGGNDIIYGGPGVDMMSGGAGDDIFMLGAASEFVAGESYDGGAEFDILQLDFVFTVNLSTGDLTGLDGIDARFGTVELTAAQLDALAAVTGNFVLTTGGSVSMNGVTNAVNGNSVFTLSAAGNVFDLTGFVPGQAQVNGGAGADTITGASGFDWLIGNGGDDILRGADGNDLLQGGTGDNVIDGGAGFDAASVDFSDRTGAVVLVNGGQTGVTYAATVGGVAAGSVTDVETLSITGGGGDDRIGGVYLPFAFNGETNLIGGGGIDTAVVDLSRFSGSTRGSLADGGVLNAGSGYFQLTGIEALEFTGSTNGPGIVGGDLGDMLRGLDGNDIFDGGGGNDIVIGGGGNDVLLGGTGDNVIDGGVGLDIAAVDFSDRTGAVVLVNGGQAGVTYGATVGGIAAGSVTDVEALAIIGGSGDDRIGGVYVPFVPNGVLNLAGGGGTDTAVVDLGHFSGSASGSVVGGLRATGGLLGAGSATLQLIGIETLEFTGNANDSGIFGGGLSDLLRGLDGNDVFDGGGGDDILSGGGGDDRLAGGTGNDEISSGQGRNIVEGGDGIDTLVLEGSRSSYRFVTVGQQMWVTGANDHHLVAGVESVRFADATASWSELAANAPSFEPFRYTASYADLMAAFGADAMAATNHYLASGFAEGRVASFDALAYTASYADLIAAFGTDGEAAARHYIVDGRGEGRAASFDSLRYIASYGDLIRAFGADTAAATEHYIRDGHGEGRDPALFDPLLYLASYGDLIRAFGIDTAAATEHYLLAGHGEGRDPALFDPLLYLASYGDLIRAFGTDAAAATRHYIRDGMVEGRDPALFDPLAYGATYGDLTAVFGNDAAGLTRHYLDYGFHEGRAALGFDAVGYLLSYSDLGASGLGADGALRHWLDYGAAEGRAGDAAFGREQPAHEISAGVGIADILDTGGDRDWFGIELAAGEGVAIGLESGDFDPSLSLYDSAGRLVAFDDDGGAGDDAALGFAASTAGLFYIVVTGAGGAGAYALDVDAVI